MKPPSSPSVSPPLTPSQQAQTSSSEKYSRKEPLYEQVSPFGSFSTFKNNTSALDSEDKEARRFYLTTMMPTVGLTPDQINKRKKGFKPLTIEHVFGVNKEEAFQMFGKHQHQQQQQQTQEKDSEFNRLMASSASALFQRDQSLKLVFPSGSPSTWTKDVLWRLPWIDQEGKAGLFSIANVLSVDSFAPKDVVVQRIMSKISELEGAVLNRVFHLQKAEGHQSLATESQSSSLEDQSQSKTRQRYGESFQPPQKPGFSPMNTHNFYRIIRSKNLNSLHSEAISVFLLMRVCILSLLTSLSLLDSLSLLISLEICFQFVNDQ